MAKSKYIETLEEQYTKKDGKSVLRYKAPDNKWRYIQTDKDASGMPSGGGMVEVKWQELKDKRDNGELNPGSLYRITDYQCTTTQENTKSAGHQFDIVLLALSENKLAEEGWAMEHPSDVYDVTFMDDVTKKCYIFDKGYTEEVHVCNLVDAITLNGLENIDFELLLIDEANKTATSGDIVSTSINDLDSGAIENCPYSYFQNSNLSAWKVWYCLDNDKSRFAWADDSVDEGSPASINFDRDDDTVTLLRRQENDELISNIQYYAWGSNFNLYTLSATPHVNDTLYEIVINASLGIRNTIDSGRVVKSFTPAHEGTNLPNGRGVIYRLIDEFNNDCPYDFKNIQFIRPMTGGVYDPDNGEDTWVYTFTNTNEGIKDASFAYFREDLEFSIVYAEDNYINPNVDSGYYLPNNVLIGNDTMYYNRLDSGSINNTCLHIYSTILYATSDTNDVESGSIYIGGKKVLTES